MELRDLIVTPLLIILVYVVAYIIKPHATDEINRKYFIPALTARIFGALALGFIYQFYYSGGDTFNYHTHGSRHVWEAFMDDPVKGFRLLSNNGKTYTDVYNYSSKIYFFNDPSSYAIIKLASVFDLLTFSSYSGTAILFSVIGFAGSWLLFLTFYRLYGSLHKYIAIATLFIPSIIFWGSGLLKDTITLACLGIGTFMVYKIFINKRFNIFYILLLMLSLNFLYVIKIYILLTFLPASIVWIFMTHFSNIKSLIFRMMVFPFVAITAIVLGYFALLKAGEDNPKYALNLIAKTAQVTAYDIRYWTGRDAGSGYSLGDLDGTWQSMIKLAPNAIGVSLFRPFLWEVKNPLMLLAAIESFVFLIFTAYILFKVRLRIFSLMGKPLILFCLVFSITFAFAVGVSTFNFGSLARYKIPLLPFYSLALILIHHYSNKERKLSVLEVTE